MSKPACTCKMSPWRRMRPCLVHARLDKEPPERVWIRHGMDVFTKCVPDSDEYVLAESVRESCCVTEGVLCMPEEPCTCCTIRDEREDSGPSGVWVLTVARFLADLDLNVEPTSERWRQYVNEAHDLAVRLWVCDAKAPLLAALCGRKG